MVVEDEDGPRRIRRADVLARELATRDNIFEESTTITNTNNTKPNLMLSVVVVGSVVLVVAPRRLTLDWQRCSGGCCVNSMQNSHFSDAEECFPFSLSLALTDIFTLNPMCMKLAQRYFLSILDPGWTTKQDLMLC